MTKLHRHDEFPTYTNKYHKPLMVNGMTFAEWINEHIVTLQEIYERDGDWSSILPDEPDIMTQYFYGWRNS